MAYLENVNHLGHLTINESTMSASFELGQQRVQRAKLARVSEQLVEVGHRNVRHANHVVQAAQQAIVAEHALAIQFLFLFLYSEERAVSWRGDARRCDARR